MKNSLPNILLHPNKYDYSLDDIEISYLQEAKKDLINKYYNLVVKSLWSSIVSNLRRRVELYGSHNFIDSLEDKEKSIYFKNSYTITEKFSLLNNLVIIKTCFKLNIISERTYTVLSFFYWFSKNSADESFTFEDIIAMITLIEKNLFKIKIDYIVQDYYKKNTEIDNTNSFEQRERQEDLNPIEPKRRKNDYINTHNTSKKIKKEDLFMMQKTTASRKRRKEDYSKQEENNPKQRKSDLTKNQNQAPSRRKEDTTTNTPTTRRRRKND
jgi:hypothetical protein